MELWNLSAVAELLAPITSLPGPGAFLPGADRAGKAQAQAQGTPLHPHTGALLRSSVLPIPAKTGT